MIATEKFTLARSIAGWVIRPTGSGSHPLLTELCGQDPRKTTILRSEFQGINDVLAHMKDVAYSLGMTIQVCGDHKRSPTIILRKRLSTEIEPLTLKVNLKHCVFLADAESWSDYGYGEILPLLNSLLVGQSLIIQSSPSRESRMGLVTVERRGAAAWKVSGHIACPWDDADSLANELGVLLQEQCDQLIPEADSDLKAFINAHNAKHGTSYVDAMTLGRFMESIPMRATCDGPGTEWDFSQIKRGAPSKVLQLLDAKEQEAINHDETEWTGLKEYFQSRFEDD